MAYDGTPTPEEDALVYLWFAKEHSWPATVVDAQPWWVVEQYQRLSPVWNRAVAALREAAR